MTANKRSLSLFIFYVLFLWLDFRFEYFYFSEGFFDAPLNLRMKGLEYMNDDPNSVDVLYAKVELDDESDRLIFFHVKFVLQNNT